METEAGEDSALEHELGVEDARGAHRAWSDQQAAVTQQRQGRQQQEGQDRYEREQVDVVQGPLRPASQNLQFHTRDAGHHSQVIQTYHRILLGCLQDAMQAMQRLMPAARYNNDITDQPRVYCGMHQCIHKTARAER